MTIRFEYRRFTSWWWFFTVTKVDRVHAED